MTQAQQGEFRELIEAMRELVPLLTRIVEMPISHHPQAGQVQQVTLPPQLPPVSKGERAAWFAAMVTVLALAVVVMQGQRISDMRAAMTAEAAQRDAHEAWAREESNITRGYIWTGKVPVANPYPKPETQK
jgi:hypothetical protein